MEVTHLSNHNTHAILGGGPSEKFQMAQTGAFFDILSSSIYANGRLAVIREVLCNAWDSHIASGVMGTPVQIYLDANELVIRDFGRGIPHDLIHQIYCIYGNSTKKNDGNQTGGFGLGSKAPFAYSDHFTVTNMHEGTKVVHAISRGGTGSSDGTPERRVIVEVPTTEQGVEVKIPIRASGDMQIFLTYIKQVAKYGEMNVILNGTKLERWDLSTSKEGFIAAIDDRFGQESVSTVYIRYGNVIYPVESNSEYVQEMQWVKTFLRALPQPHRYDRVEWRICFQAEPNTITVTPSRESIQLTSRTIETLKGLFSKVQTFMDKSFYDLRQKLVKEATEFYLKNYPNKKLSFLDGGSPFLATSMLNSLGKHKSIKSIREAQEAIIHSNFIIEPGDYALRMRLIAESGARNRGTLHQFAKFLSANPKCLENFYWSHNPLKEAWKTLRLKLWLKVKADEKLDEKGLLFIHTGMKNREWEFTEFMKYEPSEEKTIFSFLKNKIFISYSKLAITDNLGVLIRDHGDFGNHVGMPVYIVPRKKDAYKNALAFFTNIGWDVIDVDAYVQKHSLQRVVERSPEPKAPKIVGIPSMMCLKDPRTGKFTARGHLEYGNGTKNLIEKPEYVLTAENLGGRDWTHKFFQCGLDSVGLNILSLFGSEGGICVNSRQKEKYIRDGAKDGWQYFGEKLIEEFETNIVLVDYFGSYALYNPLGNSQFILKNLWMLSHELPSIRKIMNYPRNLTVDECNWVSFFGRLYEYCHHGESPNYAPHLMRDNLKKVFDLIKESKSKEAYKAMLPRIQSPIVKYLDLGKLIEVIKNPLTTKQEKDDAEGILLIALEG